MLGIQSQELLVKRSEQKGKASPAREVLNVSRKGEVDLGTVCQNEAVGGWTESRAVFTWSQSVSLLRKTCICDGGNVGCIWGWGLELNRLAWERGRKEERGRGGKAWASTGPESSKRGLWGPRFYLRNTTVSRGLKVKQSCQR